MLERPSPFRLAVAVQAPSNLPILDACATFTRLFRAREFFSRTLAPSTDRSTQNFAMLSLQFLAVATLRDETPCPPMQPRPQSCSVDAPQTISLLADPWRIAANLSDADDAFAASSTRGR